MKYVSYMLYMYVYGSTFNFFKGVIETTKSSPWSDKRSASSLSYRTDVRTEGQIIFIICRRVELLG